MKRYQVIESDLGFSVVDAYSEGYPAIVSFQSETKAMHSADALNAWKEF